MILGIAYVVVAVVLCGLTFIALFPVTDVYMSRVDAIERDGLARGMSAPSWRLSDQQGREFVSPPLRQFQVVVFTDHSLKSFPSVIDGLRLLLDEDDLEVVALTQRPNEIAGPVFDMLGLGSIPVLTGTRSLYAKYNVRVTPFVVFVDTQGRSRSSSLVNHDWQLEKLWALARLPVSSEELRNERPRTRLWDQGAVEL